MPRCAGVGGADRGRAQMLQCADRLQPAGPQGRVERGLDRLGLGQIAGGDGRALDRQRLVVGQPHAHEARHLLAAAQRQGDHLLRRGREHAALDPDEAGPAAARAHVLAEAGQPGQRLLEPGGDEIARAVARGDQAARGQLVQRLAHRGARDLEPLGQDPLRRQRLAVLEPAAGDGGGDPLDDLQVERRGAGRIGPQLVQVPAGLGGRQSASAMASMAGSLTRRGAAGRRCRTDAPRPA